MMNLLLTGATGFIGKHVLQELLQKTKYKITVMIRPDTKSRLNDFMDEVDIVEIDLTNIYKLRSYLSENIFEKIIHIGAIRGGRKYSKTDYFTANVKATEQIALAAKEANSRLVFCSSVGVFGAIPLELPANNQTQKQTDNYYHYTKIEAEKIIQKQVLYGLDAIIIRPAITYGVGDYGFPYTLTKMIDKKILFMPNKIVRIHLTNVHVLAEGFVKALNNNI
ncbi:MAG: NAD(P)-dependent oxidoreductase, partial [Candidatus Cloacimonadota bacterium]|nr:NAD(P)-dependent oxidoreductase [Candidatus Cloacimonadota bacterium]